jgi:aerobic-type carbon monoxide dehydrogenase small subunit (CoxS/CutS family)
VGGFPPPHTAANEQRMKRNPIDSLAQNNLGRVAPGGLSRRTFLKSLGTSAVTTAALGADNVAKGLAQANAERPQGPGAVAVTLMVNGEKKSFSLEPRVTLLEALRGHAGLTGAKEACDRATCGACTVLLNGTPVYACSMLAIEAQGAEITTIEGIARDGKLTALQKAMVDKDGLQCGYCSPGMVMVLTALLRKNPRPTLADVRRAVAGNLCRCGSYPRIFAATLAASGQKPVTKLNLLSLHDHAVA